MRILIGGVVSRHPYIPGEVLYRGQYVKGLQRLGHEVFWIEQLEPEWCVDRDSQPADYENAVNREHFKFNMRYFGLDADHSVQLYKGGVATLGMSFQRLLTVAATADLLINFSGHVKDARVLDRIQRRVYVDPDPVYTQLWHSEYGAELGFESHDVFVTRGLNIGTQRCEIPTGEMRWEHCLPPIVPDEWTVESGATEGPITTVASWGRYGDLCYRGEWYRSKISEFARLAELPRRVVQEFRVALTGSEWDPATAELMVQNGWSLLDGATLSTLTDYRDFISRSRAEIGIAKHAYAKAHSGWFSERAGQYLACGKPVLAQSTGFEEHLPAGLGLLTYRNLEEAAAGVEAINSDYETHSRAARDFVHEHLDYRRTLTSLLERCFHDASSSQDTQARTASEARSL